MKTQGKLLTFWPIEISQKSKKFANPLEPIMYSVRILLTACCDWSSIFFIEYSYYAVLRKGKMAPSKGEIREEQVFYGTFRDFSATKKTG